MNGEIKCVEEVLKAERDGVLFVGRFKPEVYGRTDKNASVSAVFKNNRAVPNLLDRYELLGCSCWFCRHITFAPMPSEGSGSRPKRRL